jgi:hypothetical protein
MEDFMKLPENLRTQKNLDELLKLEQERLELEKLRLQQGFTCNDIVTGIGLLF